MAFPSWTPASHHDVYDAFDSSRHGHSVDGKVVIITSGSKGIGAATAQAFAKAQARAVIIIGRNERPLREISDEIWKLGCISNISLPMSLTTAE